MDSLFLLIYHRGMARIENFRSGAFTSIEGEQRREVVLAARDVLDQVRSPDLNQRNRTGIGKIS